MVWKPKLQIYISIYIYFKDIRDIVINFCFQCSEKKENGYDRCPKKHSKKTGIMNWIGVWKEKYVLNICEHYQNCAKVV